MIYLRLPRRSIYPRTLPDGDEWTIYNVIYIGERERTGKPTGWVVTTPPVGDPA
jgi:hypothetical protein